MQNRPTRPLAALLGLALLAACGPSNASGNGPDDARSSGVRQREIPRVRVAPVERREMIQELETTSVLESELEIQVFPRMAGVVAEILAEEGDHVAAGQVLARLDDRDQVLAVEDAEVALAEARNNARVATLAVEEALGLLENSRLAAAQRQRDYDRNLRLFEESETKPLSRQEIESSRLELDSARGDERQAEVTWRRRQLEEELAETAVARAQVTLERARLALDHMRVTAPFDGVVAERMMRLGDTASSAQVAFVLTDTDALRAVFYRPQEELELFTRERESDGIERLGFRAKSEAYPGREFTGSVERISPTINAESGQFRVTARLDPPADGGAPLLPGMLVRMRIVTDRHPEALVVPKRALRREGERRYVLAVEQGSGGADGEHVLREVDVDDAFTDEDFVEVLAASGESLAVGTLVVVVGGRDLAQDDPVDIDVVPGDSDGESMPEATLETDVADEDSPS